MNNDTFAAWIRGSAPYMHAHRGRTFVIALPEAAVATDGLERLSEDLVTLHTLGIRLVVVLDAELTLAPWMTGGGSAVPLSEITGLRDVISGQRVRVEANLSTAALRTGAPGGVTHVVSGNHVMARPRGVINGTDHGAGGIVRRIDDGAIRQLLASSALVLVTPLAGSPRGETFVLDGLDLALQVAVALQADKLICLAAHDYLHDATGERLSEVTPREVEALIEDGVVPAEVERTAQLLGHGAERGIPRCHLVGWQSDGGLLGEVFTREGCGTQISEDSYQRVRDADQGDAAAIATLIEPFVASGALRARDVEDIEDDIRAFSVVELDGLIIGCAALYSLDEHNAELACFATHAEFRTHRASGTYNSPQAGQQRSVGEALLDEIIRRARQSGHERLIVLTTQAEHWFLEHGFDRAGPEALPAERRHAAEGTGRSSRVLVQPL